ncbi:hypothetical protein HanRHA438_Chr07g0324731 [Helianthus annuus]|nr:hypothetical protein HanRHA438_Chr07g0324731 [Helianthus annuus]
MDFGLHYEGSLELMLLPTRYGTGQTTGSVVCRFCEIIARPNSRFPCTRRPNSHDPHTHRLVGNVLQRKPILRLHIF